MVLMMILLEYYGAGIESASRGRGFGLQNQKPMRAGSVSVWHMKTVRGLWMRFVGRRKIWWLKYWGAEMKRLSRGGGFAGQNQKPVCVDSVLV